MPDDRDESCGAPGVLSATPAGIVVVVLLALAGVYLWAEHRSHLLVAILWLPLFACLLMHLLMHRGHGKHSTMHHPEERP